MGEKRLTPEQRHRFAVLERDGYECFYRNLAGHACSGRATAEHVIPRAELKKLWRRAHSRAVPNRLPPAVKLLRDTDLEELIANPDNGLVCCLKANIDLAAGFLHPPRQMLPQHVEDFATEYGLDWYLDDHYGFAHEAA